MARTGRRSQPAEPQALRTLGVQGRKTGVVLRDRGERDEHGMMPLDDLFSSPRKATASTNSTEDSGSEAMDLETSAGPGPRTLLQKQRNTKLPLPKSKSPSKTHLNSPAKRNPHLEHLSSPSRSGTQEDRDVTVTRRLDFVGQPDKSGSSGRSLTNGARRARRVIEDDDDSPGGESEDLSVEDMVEESLQMAAAMSDNFPGNDAHETAEQAPRDEGQLSQDKAREQEPQRKGEQPVKKRRGRPRKSDDVQPPPASKKRKSPEGSSRRRPVVEEHVNGEAEDEDEDEDEEDEPPTRAKRQRPNKAAKSPPQSRAKSTKTTGPISKKAAGKQKAAPLPVVQEDEESPEPSAEASTKAPKAPTAKSAATQNPPKKRGRPRKSDAQTTRDDIGDTSIMAVQRGPPMPKARGLVSLRHEPDAIKTTRSGRHSYRPVDYWRGEQIVREDQAEDDMFYNGGFVLPSIKEVIRVPKEAPPSKRAPRSKTRTKAKTKVRQAVEEDEELEDWETNPGTVTGEIVLWEPEHEEHPPADDEPVQVMDDRIAISADAIKTQDIKDATFRFAKTLTVPFMGAGVVDLPPGAEKRPKNSRKMHMVFFVHYGKVLVTINEAQFRISAGGTWFVPRGNYYSITNDYENPCRIFFAQACEIAPQPTVEESYVEES